MTGQIPAAMQHPNNTKKTFVYPVKNDVTAHRHTTQTKANFIALSPQIGICNKTLKAGIQRQQVLSCLSNTKHLH